MDLRWSLSTIKVHLKPVLAIHDLLIWVVISGAIDNNASLVDVFAFLFPLFSLLFFVLSNLRSDPIGKMSKPESAKRVSTLDLFVLTRYTSPLLLLLTTNQCIFVRYDYVPWLSMTSIYLPLILVR